jgi:2-hydroxycyclohexanecarboxyl-CoA dehydrogenase
MTAPAPSLELPLLQNRVAVITGGAGGIGGAVSRRFAEAKAVIVVNDVDETRLADITELISSRGGNAVAVPGDIRDPTVVETLAEAAQDVAGGSIDILVNNVGDFRPSGRFVNSDRTSWQLQYENNLGHVLSCCSVFVPGMIKAGRGSIVNVSTVESLRGVPYNVVYSAFNSAVNAFTRSLAVELAPNGVRVNAIAPDLTDTLQTPAEWMLSGRDPSMVKSWVPLGRFGQPEDQADVVLFLASDLSRFITGHVIPVDGGTIAASGWYRRTGKTSWTNMPDAP